MATTADLPTSAWRWARPSHNGRGTFTPHLVTGWGARTACGWKLGSTTTSHTPYAGDRRCQRCQAAATRAGVA
jgi:hypothetical protein